MDTSGITTTQADQPLAVPHEFAMQFTSTPRGARLARRLVSHRLGQWGYPYDSPVNETLTLITAELAANAVRHGHVPGRDFHLRLTADPELLRVEVTDTRTERMPSPFLHEASDDAESGRGLLLVTRLATRWGADPRPVAPGKTVWAELSPAAPCPTAGISAPASPDVRSCG
ncbi:ATP-binding protein [Streptomyces sp. NPDC058442]|uniref:ATP-binding protein n=1 Tax=Streptomyces sp. NPDC058442 TaxID=3346503 RepID=UPI00364C3118